MNRILRSLFEDPTFHVTSRFGLFDGEGDGGEGGEGGAGSGGEGGGSQSEAEHAAAQQQQESGAAGQQRQAGGFRRDGQWIPKHRFDEVNQKYAAYRNFGPPTEVQAKLARLAELEKMPQNRYNESQATEIREDLLRVFPELRSVVDSHKNQSTTFIAHGARQNDRFMKELTIEANEANNLYLQELLGGVISRTPELSQRFYARDPSVFDDAFKIAKGIFWPNARRTVPGLQTVQKKTPAQAGANNGKAGKTEEKEIQPGPLYERQILDRASEEAFAKISEQME